MKLWMGVSALPHFQSLGRGRLHVHTLATDQFQTRHLSIRIVHPLSRNTVTGNALLPYLWLDGSLRYPSSQAVMQRADDLYGSSIRSSITKRGDRHVLAIGASVPEETSLSDASGLFANATDLTLELLTNPLSDEGGFVEQHVQKQKALHRQRIEGVFDDKISFALQRCVSEACAGLPVGLPRLGYLEDLEGLARQSLWELQERVLAEAQVHVYLTGKFDDARKVANEVLEKLEEALPSSTAAGPARVAPLQVRGGEVKHVVEQHAVSQAQFDLAYRTAISFSSDDYPAMMVMNGVLGGFSHSKLFMNVREKASLAYFTVSRLDGMTGVLTVQNGIDPLKAQQAYDIIREQVSAVQEGQVTDDELAFTVSSLRNSYQQTFDSPMSLAEFHFSGLLTGRVREVEEMTSLVEQVTKDDITRVAANLNLDTIYVLAGQEVSLHA